MRTWRRPPHNHCLLWTVTIVRWPLAPLAALANWAVNPGSGVNAAGARALVDGCRAQAGSLPPLGLDTDAATGLQNYVAGQVDLALNASGEEDERYADRNVRQLLTHLPPRQRTSWSSTRR